MPEEYKYGPIVITDFDKFKRAYQVVSSLPSAYALCLRNQTVGQPGLEGGNLRPVIIASGESATRRCQITVALDDCVKIKGDGFSSLIPPRRILKDGENLRKLLLEKPSNLVMPDDGYFSWFSKGEGKAYLYGLITRNEHMLPCEAKDFDGILVDLSKSEVSCFDTYRMAKTKTRLAPIEQRDGAVLYWFFIPSGVTRALKELGDQPVHIDSVLYEDEDNILFTAGDDSMQVRVEGGRMPAYPASPTLAPACSVEVEKKVLIKALMEADYIAKNRRGADQGGVMLSLYDDKSMEVYTRSYIPDGNPGSVTLTERDYLKNVPIQIRGGKVPCVKFIHGRFIADALRHFGDKTTLSFLSSDLDKPGGPVLIREGKTEEVIGGLDVTRDWMNRVRVTLETRTEEELKAEAGDELMAAAAAVMDIAKQAYQDKPEPDELPPITEPVARGEKIREMIEAVKVTTEAQVVLPSQFMNCDPKFLEQSITDIKTTLGAIAAELLVIKSEVRALGKPKLSNGDKALQKILDDKRRGL